MDSPQESSRLSRIQTLWTLVNEAKGGQDASLDAQEELIKRYGGALYRYLLVMVRDPVLAEDLGQEFAVRFLRGDFRTATPERGRFRDFVKTCAINLVRDHYRKMKRTPRELIPDSSTHAMEIFSTDDPDFVSAWREELLSRAWDYLKSQQAASGLPFYDVLRVRAENETLRGEEFAQQLGVCLGRELSRGAARKLVMQARRAFSESLVQDVAQSLPVATDETIEEELAQLELLTYCGNTLNRSAK